MTPEQAVTALDVLLSKLGSVQRSRLSPAPALSGATNGLVQEDLSFDTISDAIWTLWNNDARPTLQVFFDQVSSSLYGSTGMYDDMVVALIHRLDTINRIILAAYHVWTRPRRDSWMMADSVSELGILFRSIVSQVLEPLWILFREMRQQHEEVSGSQGDEESIRILLQVEIVIASLLRTLIIIYENQSSETHLLEFTGLFYLVVRIFDEALLPMHLSPECDEDVVHLVAGLLTLFQIFRTLEHVNLVPAIQDQLLSGLLSSDIIERTIRSLQATSSDMVAATCEQFVARLLCLGGIFSESVLDDNSTRTIMAGDTLPGLHVLTTFNLHDMHSYLGAGNQGTEQEEEYRVACQRWGIAFYYLQVRFHKCPSGNKAVWESIPILLGNEKSLDHLYGASWIELTYVYVTLDQAIDPEGNERRPFSLATILEGLQFSVQSAEEGSLSRAMLKLHVREVLVWFWSHDGSSLKDCIAKDPPPTLLRMMFMLLEKEFSLKATAGLGQRRLLNNDGKMEHMAQFLLKYPLALCSIKTIFRDICQLLDSTPMEASQVDPRWRILCVVCSIIKSFAGFLPSGTAGQEDDAAIEFQFRILEEVIDVAITLCVSGKAVEAVLNYLWEMLDTVVPLLKPCDGKEPLIEWEGYQNPKRVIGKLLFQVEQCQAGTVWQGQHQLVRFFKTMWSNIRVLSIHLDVDDEYILEDQPDLLTSLWEAVHDFMDRLLPSPETTLSNVMNQHGINWQETWSCVADCTVEVMLLLHNIHIRFPSSVSLTTEEDRPLMVHFCLELMDELVKGRYVAYQPQPASDPRVLAFALVSWMTRTLNECLGSGLGSEGVTVEGLVAWLDMLLDGLCESLLREADDTMVWRTLRVYMKTLLTCFHQKQSPSSSTTATTASKTTAKSSNRLELIVYPAPQEHSTHSWIRSRLRYQGHKELLNSLWRRWDAAAKGFIDWIRERPSRAERGAVNSASAVIPFDRSGIQGQQGEYEDTKEDKQVMSQLGRVVSDILTLMRMIVHEGPKQGHQCRQLDLEFVSWIMDLIDSQLVTDAAQTLRDLSVVALAPVTILAPATASAESNGFTWSLNELTRIREECVRAQVRYRN